MIVTTPEKWDVITRKGGDVSVAATVRLLIIDEVNIAVLAATEMAWGSSFVPLPFGTCLPMNLLPVPFHQCLPVPFNQCL